MADPFEKKSQVYCDKSGVTTLAVAKYFVLTKIQNKDNNIFSKNTNHNINLQEIIHPKRREI